MASESAAASVVIVTHNSADLVGPVIENLISDPSGPSQVIVVDNASTDRTTRLVQSFGVDLIESSDNIGFAGGCHLGVSAATEPTIVFLGHDTEPRHGWLPPLVEAVVDPSVGAAMATIEEVQRPGHFNTSGGHLNYFGLAWISSYGEVIPEETGHREVAFPSGAAMAIRKDVWEMLGGFREGFFMYQEDTDLGWRIRLAGLRSVRVPESLVRHHYEFARYPEKMMWLERNRLLMISSNYQRQTLWVLLPALAAVEVGVLLTAIRHRWARAKVRSWKAAWSARGALPEWRDEVTRIRRVTDASILGTFDHRISTSPQMRPGFGATLADRFFGSYQAFALIILRLLER